MNVSTVRVVLPAHLKTLAGVAGEVHVDVVDVVNASSIIDALEESFPALRGTIRNPATNQRRPFIRFFVAGDDLSHHPLGQPLPHEVVTGHEAFIVIGAMAGG